MRNYQVHVDYVLIRQHDVRRCYCYTVVDVKYLSFSINDACRCIRCQVFRWAATQLAKGHEKWVWGRGVPIALGVGLLLEEKFAKMNENGAFQCILKRLAVYKTSIKHRLT